MQNVEIYTSPLCGFCHAAKRLLNQKGVEFSEINVLTSPERKPEMMERAGGRHVHGGGDPAAAQRTASTGL